jgi:hypothetical protein
MLEQGTKYLRLVLGAFEWLVPISAYALIPMLIPVAIIGIGAASFGWSAPPHTLGEIARRLSRALVSFGLLLLAMVCLFVILLTLSPQGIGFLALGIPALVVVPLVACWLFGLVWRLGYDVGLLSAHIRAARRQARARQRR